jgi:hypothetical protein
MFKTEATSDYRGIFYDVGSVSTDLYRTVFASFFDRVVRTVPARELFDV